MSEFDTLVPPAGTSARPPAAAVRSHVVVQNLSLLYAGVLLPSFGLVPLLLAAFLFSDGDATAAGGLLVLGLGMLAGTWPLLRRAQLPYLATLSAEGLRLEPRDRTVQLGKPAQLVPLANISGFSEQVLVVLKM